MSDLLITDEMIETGDRIDAPRNFLDKAPTYENIAACDDPWVGLRHDCADCDGLLNQSCNR